LDPELLNLLQECTAVVNKLLSLLDDDQEDMPYCVNGEILDAYNRGTEEAAQVACSIREELRQLLEI